MLRGMPPRWSKSNHVGTGLGMLAASERVRNNYGANTTNGTWCLFEGFCVASIVLHRLHIENDLMYKKRTALFPSYILRKMRHGDIRQHHHCDIALITKDYLCLCVMRTVIFGCNCIIKHFPLIFYLHIFLSWILHILYNYYSCFLCWNP